MRSWAFQIWIKLEYLSFITEIVSKYQCKTTVVLLLAMLFNGSSMLSRPAYHLIAYKPQFRPWGVF